MEYGELRKMETTHQCAECGGNLTTIYDNENQCYRSACGTNQTHNGITRKTSTTEKFARGEGDKIAGPGAQHEIEVMARRGVGALNLMPRSDLGNGKALMPADVHGLITWGNEYGLVAELGHVLLYFGQPYCSIDGYYYLNHQRTVPFGVRVRPMKILERDEQKIGEGDFAYIATALLQDVELPDTGIGIVTAEEIALKSKKDASEWRSPVVHGHPQRMAEKRAEWQLLRKLIPLVEKRVEKER